MNLAPLLKKPVSTELSEGQEFTAKERDPIISDISAGLYGADFVKDGHGQTQRMYGDTVVSAQTDFAETYLDYRLGFSLEKAGEAPSVSQIGASAALLAQLAPSSEAAAALIGAVIKKVDAHVDKALAEKRAAVPRAGKPDASPQLVCR